MSFFHKLIENKAVIAGAALLSLGGLVLWAYKSYEQKQKQEQGSQEDKFEPVRELKIIKKISFNAEINKLKSQINVTNPSLEDIKKVLTFAANYAKTKTFAATHEFKVQRRKRFPKGVRFERLGDYLRFSIQGIKILQASVMQMQQQQTTLMENIGLTQASIQRHAPALAAFLQELLGGGEDITLDQVKKNLELKNQYLEDHGERLIQNLVEISSSLSLEQKQYIPHFLNVILSDQIFQHEPSLDKEEFEVAYEKYKTQIQGELIGLERTLMPLMGKLQAALIGDDMGGFGGFGGQGTYPSEYEQGYDQGMEGLGGDMGGEMGTREAMMAHYLDQLRQTDVEGFNQMMAMMQAQGGMMMQNR